MPAGSRSPCPARGVPGHGREPGPGSDDRGNPMTAAEGQSPAPGGTGGVLGGQPGGPVIVCGHGLGGAAVNWSAIAPLLTGSDRLLARDLAGHGLTQSAGRGTDVGSNRALLHRFIESVPAVCAGPGELVNRRNPAPPARPAGSAGPVRPVVLMGNSMGGMISLLEVGAEPGAVAGLILIDPALPFVLARPDPAVASLFAL